MAKVFSAKELENGHVPKLTDFERMANIILEMPRPEQTAYPLELMVYGSVDRLEHDIRSDLDCLIIWPEDLSYSGIKQYLSWVKDIAHSMHIPIEPLAIRRDIAERGEHGLEVLFMEYLIQQEPKVRLIQGRPASRLSLPEKVPSAISIFHNFASAKTEKFAKAAINSRVDFNTFQRALELVRALDRKLERIPGIADNTNTLVKLAIHLGIAGKDIDGVKVATDFLCSTDAAYNRLLLETLHVPEDGDTRSAVDAYEHILNCWYPQVVNHAITLSMGSHAIINALQK